MRKDASAYAKLQRQLLASQKMATETRLKLMDTEAKRFDETVTLQSMLEGRDRELISLRRYVEEIDELLASGQCSDITLARLRKELSATQVSDDDQD